MAEQTKQDANAAWWDNFRGRCITCKHASKTNRKHEMTCHNEYARNRGLPTRGGGSILGGIPVYKLYGCVYFKSLNEE